LGYTRCCWGENGEEVEDEEDEDEDEVGEREGGRCFLLKASSNISRLHVRRKKKR
jgi:hypothetical protein